VIVNIRRKMAANNIKAGKGGREGTGKKIANTIANRAAGRLKG
jgi:hypothetical protein